MLGPLVVWLVRATLSRPPAVQWFQWATWLIMALVMKESESCCRGSNVQLTFQVSWMAAGESKVYSSNSVSETHSENHKLCCAPQYSDTSIIIMAKASCFTRLYATCCCGIIGSIRQFASRQLRYKNHATYVLYVYYVDQQQKRGSERQKKAINSNKYI